MFGQGMFAAQLFAASCCCHNVPPPTPTPSGGGPGAGRPADIDRRRDMDDDDVALITALLDL